MNKKITCFKAYDARGKVPDDLNADITYRVGRAYAEFIKPKHDIAGLRSVIQRKRQLAIAIIPALVVGGTFELFLGHRQSALLCERNA